MVETTKEALHAKENLKNMLCACWQIAYYHRDIPPLSCKLISCKLVVVIRIRILVSWLVLFHFVFADKLFYFFDVPYNAFSCSVLKPNV